MPREAKVVGWTDIVMPLKIGNRIAAAHLEVKQLDLITLLASTGATHQEIGEVVGTTAATVQNALARNRRRGKTQPRGQRHSKLDPSEEVAH